jgi:hypothetical protein
MSDGELSRLEVLRYMDQRRLTTEAAAQLLKLDLQHGRQLGDDLQPRIARALRGAMLGSDAPFAGAGPKVRIQLPPAKSQQRAV